MFFSNMNLLGMILLGFYRVNAGLNFDNIKFLIKKIKRLKEKAIQTK